MANRQMTVRRGPKRKTFWLGSSPATGFTTLSGSTKAIALSFSGAQVSAFAPFTIVRTVGLLAIRSDQVAAGENQLGAFGQMVITELARAAGAASIPGPATDSADDMWYQFGWFANRFDFLDATGFAPNGAQLFAYDSRAQRKVEDGQALVNMIENLATTGMQFWMSDRTLIKVS